MQLSKLTAGVADLRSGTELYDKRGLCYGFNRDLGEEVLVEILGLSWTQDCMGEPCEEALEGTGQFVVFSKDELWTERPKQLVPTYLESDIARAKEQVAHWKQLADKARDTRAALVKETDKLKARIEKVSRKYPQLEYLCDFVEGVDLWIASWRQYGHFKLCKVSQLKGDYGLRMVSIQTECRDSKWIGLYDWKLHEYSDDSGNTYNCVIGRSEEECIKRLEEYLEKMAIHEYHWDVRVLQGMQDAGVTLPQKELDYIEKEKAETKAQLEKNRDYEKKRLLEKAKDYGLELKEVK